ncbi:MAG TPA: hypothetical protein VM388_03580 [Acidimicrobiales bacterium]|nr:hypothetical protein [Acidimicrobiales bacterium]
MGRRWAAVLCTVVLAAGCSDGSDGPDDPVAEPPASTAGPGTSGATGGYLPSTMLGTITDPDIDESSGLAASRRNPGLLWTHNDSGDEPLVYCLDLKAAPCGVWRVTGAEAWDWEDMAAGPGPRAGEPYLYLGDIGDNLDQRSQIVVYRIPEPAVAGTGPVTTKAAPAASAPAEALRLRFPDGPHDAEALAVHPTTGDLYVVSKDAQSAKVYKAAAPLDPAKVTTMTQVGTIRLGPGNRGLEQITGADISPDGRRVAVSTYAQGYELEVPAGGVFDDVWSQPPAPVALGPRLQGEAIAYRLDGKALLTTSEIVPSPLHQVERR